MNRRHVGEEFVKGRDFREGRDTCTYTYDIARTLAYVQTESRKLLDQDEEGLALTPSPA